MDGYGFDTLARGLAAGISRRALGTGVLGLGLAGLTATDAGAKRKRKRKKCKGGKTRCGRRCVRGRCCPGKACGGGDCRCLVAVEGDAFCAVDGVGLIDPCTTSQDCDAGFRCIPGEVVNTCVLRCNAG
jgi:hypothetical protein